MRKILAILLVFVCLACSAPAPQVGWRAYCTCDHGGERLWRGTMRSSRDTAEKDQKRHNKKAHHCATVEQINKAGNQTPSPSFAHQSGYSNP